MMTALKWNDCVRRLLWVTELLHNVRLRQEVLWVHCACKKGWIIAQNWQIPSLDMPEKIMIFCANLQVFNSFQLCTKV